jgi:hypothetical protein
VLCNPVTVIDPCPGAKDNIRVTDIAESVTVTLPRSTVRDVLSLSSDLNERMHALLERNTDGQLTPTERNELEALVRVAEIGQILSMSLRGLPTP